MTTIAFVVHPERLEAEALAETTTRWLDAHGHQVRRIDGCFGAAAASADELDGVDLILSLGGDGTMLCATALAACAGTAVLGINLGSLGYLTEVEPAGVEQALERYLSGDYRIEARTLLDVSIEPGRTVDGRPPDGRTFLAVNEAVVEKTVPGHTIRVAASLSGRPLVTFAADGLLVATPTGSTAYNLSVRGPILSPRLQALVLTPISPHMLFDRPLVLDPDEVVSLELVNPRDAVLVIDGSIVASLEPGDTVVCKASASVARLVTFGDYDFHAVLRARFHLADR